jgi:hypothetical protein
MGRVLRSLPVAVLLAGSTCLLIAVGGGAVHGQDAGEPPGVAVGRPTAPELATAREAEAFEAIRKASTGTQLRPLLAGARGDVLSAGVARLGEIGDAESVAALQELFAAAPRMAGAGGEDAVGAAILVALARTERPEAKTAIENVVTTWLEEGPKVDGPYSHVYDPQYYAVVCAGIESLGTFQDEEIDARLQGIADDEDLFYTLRETAWRSLLKRDMRRRGLSTAQERTAYLLDRIEPDGVFVEKRWSGEKPGSKTTPALRQAIVEDMVAEIGWQAADEMQRCLAAGPDEAHTVAAARMLAVAALRHLPAATEDTAAQEVKQALLAVAEALGKLPDRTAESPTVAQVVGYVSLGADVLQDRDLWEKVRPLVARSRRPGDWQGPPPSRDEIGLVLPAGATFVPELSSRVRTPYGTVLQAFYLTEQEAPATTAYFEELLGREARPVGPPGSKEGQAACRQIEFGQAPDELKEWMSFGVTVYVGPPDGFEQRQFGEVVRTGKAAFLVTRLVAGGT